ANLHWIDSYQAQIVPFGASVFGIFLMRQFFLGLPNDLWEAAQLDGSGHLRFLWSIAAPLARPPMVTIALFQLGASGIAVLWPLLAAALLVACGGGGTSSGPAQLGALNTSVQVTFWHALSGTLQTQLTALTDQFNSSQSNVHVNLVAKGAYTDLGKSILTGLA